MRYDHECTVWHKTEDGYLTLHYPCCWQGSDSGKVSEKGRTDESGAKIFLPVDAEIRRYDYIAKGMIESGFYENVSDLLKDHSPLKVMTVSRKDYGSAIMQHTEVMTVWETGSR